MNGRRHGRLGDRLHEEADLGSSLFVVIVPRGGCRRIISPVFGGHAIIRLVDTSPWKKDSETRGGGKAGAGAPPIPVLTANAKSSDVPVYIEGVGTGQGVAIPSSSARSPTASS